MASEMKQLEDFVQEQDDSDRQVATIQLQVVYHGGRERDARYEASVTTYRLGQEYDQGDTGSGSGTAPNPARAVEEAFAGYTPKPDVGS